jgi:ribonuclease BN (tRNA processing enzyme)
VRTTTDTQANVCVLICTSNSVHIFGVAHTHTHKTDNLMNNALDTMSVTRVYIEHIHINFQAELCRTINTEKMSSQCVHLYVLYVCIQENDFLFFP